MTILNFSGFPKEVGSYIELPNIAELIMMPFFTNSTAIEDVKKYGTDFQRELIDLTPIRNTSKYVAACFQVQLLTPNVITIANQLGPFERDWHIDGGINGGNSLFHLLLNDVKSLTDFNSQEFKLEIDDEIFKNESKSDPWYTINNIINEKADYFGITPKKMEPNKIITFDSRNIHRSPEVKNYEFRFMWRVLEIDQPPMPIEKTMLNFSTVAQRMEILKSIEKQEKGFFVNVY